MRLTDLPTRLSALALAAILPLAVTACGDDVTGTGDTEDDGSTTGDETTTDTPTTQTTTTDPGTTTIDPGTTTTDPGSTTDDTATDTDPTTDGTTGGDTDDTDSGDTTSSTGGDETTGGMAECGNGEIEGDEVCDGDAVGDAVCPIAGTVACADDCTLDLSGCTDMVTVCNMPAGVIDNSTTADAPLVDTISVTDDFFVTDVNVTVDVTHTWISDISTRVQSPDGVNGALLSDRACLGGVDDMNARFDDEGLPLECSDVAPGVAGDIVPEAQLSDFIGINALGDWSLQVWDNASGDDGTLNEWCVEFTLSADDPVMCGDGVAHYGETCDGMDLNEQSCTDIDGYIAGELGCADDCTLDLSACIAPGCGNGIFESDTETCDGAELDGMTCDDFPGFTGDGLACADDCSGFDTSGCTAIVCGNNSAETGEACDGTDLAGMSCDDLPGFTGPGLACAGDCTFDTSACTDNSVCGDGEVNGNEECEGTSIGGETCESQGFTGGSLGCGDDCTLDTAECSDTVLAYCSAPGIATIDEDTITDTITVADDAVVADVDVFVDITHTWNGDLNISVVDPADTSIQIRGDDVCNNNNDDIFAFFNDEAPGVADCEGVPAIEGNITPTEALSGFDGAGAMGDWRIEVSDSATGDGGMLNEWCLYITAEP